MQLLDLANGDGAIGAFERKTAAQQVVSFPVFSF